MNYTRPPEFPTLKQFLREDEDEIFAGVQKVLTDIRTAWGGGSRMKVERARINALKKLDDAARAKLTRVINAYIEGTLRDLNMAPKLSMVTDVLNTKQEAEAAAMVFTDLANRAAPEQSKIADVARNFLHMATLDGTINEDRKSTLYQQVLTPAMRDVGPGVVSMFANQLPFFLRVFALDGDLGMQPNEAARLLGVALSKTEGEGKEGKEQAVLNVVNGLQKFRSACLEMVDGIITVGKNRPPSPDDKKPATGGTQPTPHPAAAKPVSKPGGASMQAQADANQAAAKDAGSAMAAAAPAAPAAAPAGKDNTADIISGLVNLGYEAGVAKRLASRIPKGLSVEDGIKQILRGNKPGPKV
jgi:hypothetical protein